MFAFGAIARGIHRNVKRKGPLVASNHARKRASSGPVARDGTCRYKKVRIRWPRLIALLMTMVGIPLLAVNARRLWIHMAGQHVRPVQNDVISLPLKTAANVRRGLSSYNYQLDWDKVADIRNTNSQKYDFPYSTSGIDRRSNLSLQEFIDVYDGKWPVILTDVVTKWPAMSWDRDFLLKRYGDQVITVRSSSDGTLAGASGQAMSLLEFCQLSGQRSEVKWAYAEDELFILSRPQLKKDILKPMYFSEDFFQQFPAETRPWDSMLLWGSPASRSALHVDPYNWTGTNAVLRGRKSWKLYLPGQDDLLYIKPKQKCGFPLECWKYNSLVDAFRPDAVKYPRFSEAKALTFDLMPGEMLVIPSGWFHQAFNSEETIAVSGQVMNSQNYLCVLEEIFKAGNLPRHSLSKNWEKLKPRGKVKHILSMLPQSVLNRGKKVTEDANNYVMRSTQV